MSAERQRRRRDVRDSHPPSMVLTDRDTDIIEMVYRCRILRQDQIHALFFSKSKSASQRRLQLLFQHGYLARRFLTTRASYLLTQALYILDKRGAELLTATRGSEDLRIHTRKQDFSQQFVEHTLAINDVRVAVILACRQLGYAVTTWLTDFDFKADFDRVSVRGKREPVSVIPDGYFVIETSQGRAPFFLELDRGTMELSSFQTKILAYQAYIAGGGYERRFKTKSARVLTVALSEKRLKQLKRVTTEAGGRQRYWFACLADLTPTAILTNPVWQVAGNEENASLF